MRLTSLSLGVLLSLSLNTFAGYGVPYTAPLIVTSKSDTKTEGRAYAGLVWTLQEKASFIPDLTIGFRSLRVKSSDSAQGGDISVRIKLKDGIAFDSTRLSYVGGDRDLLGNIGVGYSFTNASVLGTLAAQGAYTRIGSDYEFTNKRFVPYLELLTMDKPRKVKGTDLAPI